MGAVDAAVVADAVFARRDYSYHRVGEAEVVGLMAVDYEAEGPWWR